MKIIKKNQLAILVISLMLITAGYLNYDSTIRERTEETSTNALDIASIGDAKLVNADVADENSVASSVTYSAEANINSANVISNTEETSAQIKSDTNNNGKDYFATSKLERNIMYSQMIERYQKMLESSNTESEQKAIAQQEIDKINNLQNSIMIAENLLATKGFNDSIIFVNGDSINIIIGKSELTPNEIAQIQNIISRELNASVENIHISTK